MWYTNYALLDYYLLFCAWVWCGIFNKCRGIFKNI